MVSNMPVTKNIDNIRLTLIILVARVLFADECRVVLYFSLWYRPQFVSCFPVAVEWRHHLFYSSCSHEIIPAMPFIREFQSPLRLNKLDHLCLRYRRGQRIDYPFVLLCRRIIGTLAKLPDVGLGAIVATYIAQHGTGFCTYKIHFSKSEYNDVVVVGNSGTIIGYFPTIVGTLKIFYS